MFQCSACGKVSETELECSVCKAKFRRPLPKVAQNTGTQTKVAQTTVAPVKPNPSISPERRRIMADRVSKHRLANVNQDKSSSTPPIKSTPTPTTTTTTTSSPKTPSPTKTEPTINLRALVEKAKPMLVRLNTLGRSELVQSLQAPVVEHAKSGNGPELQRSVNEIERQLNLAETQVGQQKKQAIERLLQILPVDQRGKFPGLATSLATTKPVDLDGFANLEIEVNQAVTDFTRKAEDLANQITRLLDGVPSDPADEFRSRGNNALTAKPIDWAGLNTLHEQVKQYKAQGGNAVNEKKTKIVELLRLLPPNLRGNFVERLKTAVGPPAKLDQLETVGNDVKQAILRHVNDAKQRKAEIDLLLKGLPPDRQGTFPATALSLLNAKPIVLDGFNDLKRQIDTALREFNNAVNQKKNAVTLQILKLPNTLRLDFSNRLQTAATATPPDLAAIVTLDQDVTKKLLDVDNEVNRIKLSINGCLGELPLNRQGTFASRANPLYTTRPAVLDVLEEIEREAKEAVTLLKEEAQERKTGLMNLLNEVPREQHGNVPTLLANVLTGKPINLDAFGPLEDRIRDLLQNHRQQLLARGGVDPAVAVRWKNEGIQRSVEKLKKTIDTSSEPQKQTLAGEAQRFVTSKSEEELANLTPQQQIELLTKLKCYTVSGALPPDQLNALKKMYVSIRLDKDFLTHDRQKREEVVQALVSNRDLVNAKNTWGDSEGLTEEKKRVLKKAQELQCEKLGFTPDRMVFDNITDGSAGHCAGKVVTISTDPDSIKDFREVIDTLVHETTHAYQYYLVEELDAGRLPVDDPRYAQAWLFKLNSAPAYCKPPAKLEGVDANNEVKKRKYQFDYKAYQRQPTEEHAWKAGGEIGRAFDVKAISLQMNVLSMAIEKLVPTKATEIKKLRERFTGTTSVLEKSDLIEEVENLATEAYKQVEERAKNLVSTINSYVADGFTVYGGQWSTIANSKQNIRSKLTQMISFFQTVNRLTNEGKQAEEAYKLSSTVVEKLYPKMSDYVDDGYRLYSDRWLKIANASEPFSEKKTKMQELQKTMETVIREKQPAVDEYLRFTSGKTLTTQAEANEYNRINMQQISKAEKMRQFKASRLLAEVRKRFENPN